MPLDAQQILIILLSLAAGAAIPILYDRWKERPKWNSGYIASRFERINGELSVNLEFVLINGGGNMSIWAAFLKIIPNPLFPQFGDIRVPQNFEPINLGAGESRLVSLTFTIPKPSDFKNIQDVKREELINRGLNAELQLFDNKRNRAVAPLFIYEGGTKLLFERLGAPSPQELGLMYERGIRSWLEVGKLRGNEILKMKDTLSRIQSEQTKPSS